jgi:hypothetical protein
MWQICGMDGILKCGDIAELAQEWGTRDADQICERSNNHDSLGLLTARHG